MGRWVWARTLRVYKVFRKTGQGPWLRGDFPWARRCNKLHSTICVVLLSEFVSQNVWLQHNQIVTIIVVVVADILGDPAISKL